MLKKEELYLLMRMIEHTYRCRICIIDGDNNYLFSTNFPDLDTTHLSELCNFCRKKHSDECRKWDDLECIAHSKKAGGVFYSVCPFGAMSIVGMVDIPGIQRYNIFGGIFCSRTDLPSNALVSSKQFDFPLKLKPRNLTDQEFVELPMIWEMLVRELTLFFEKKLADDEKSAMNQELYRTQEDIIQDFINGHFRRRISLSSLAVKLGKTRSYTAVIVRKIFGKSFIYLLNHRRIENAKWLLRNNYNMSVAAIAKVSGFPSPPYFFRVFQQYTGMTPREFQKIANELNNSQQLQETESEETRS